MTLTLKTKGWCDAAHTLLVVEESECSPTPVLTTQVPTVQASTSDNEDSAKTIIGLEIPAFIILILCAICSLLTFVCLIILCVIVLIIGLNC